MNRYFALLFVTVALPFTGCNKIKSLPFLGKKKPVENVQPAAAGGQAPAPAVPAVAENAGVAPVAPGTQAATPAKPEPNLKASVVALCYHRFEDRPKDSLAIKPSEFEQQMAALKEHGFTVIPMKDFLAWRRGEKDIPEKSCLISIDDGYRSGYEVAWPILKKYGYPFTMFIYTNYVKGQPKSGGQSLSWGELGEMRDAGVDIQSHTVSHSDLRSKKGHGADGYEKWIRDELVNSKKLIEQQLGVSVTCLAYPYGNHNAEVRKAAMEAGYEAAFTVYGQRLTYHTSADQLGRYALESAKPKIFQDAMKMVGGGGAGGGDDAAVSQLAGASMITQPMEGETVSDPNQVIRANLSTFGDVDPASVEVRLSGMGQLPVTFDPSTKMMEAKPTQKLHEPSYSVIVSAKVKGRKVESRWSFNFSATGAGAAALPVPTLPKR